MPTSCDEHPPRVIALTRPRTDVLARCVCYAQVTSSHTDIAGDYQCPTHASKLPVSASRLDRFSPTAPTRPLLDKLLISRRCWRKRAPACAPTRPRHPSRLRPLAHIPHASP